MHVRLPIWAVYNISSIDGYAALNINMNHLMPLGFYVRFLDKFKPMFSRYRVDNIALKTEIWNSSPKPIQVFELFDSDQ